MSQARVASPTLHRWLCRLLDGQHPWGSFDAMVGRYGLRRYRVTVFPPGISVAARRFVRAWRAWPAGGAVLALLAAMFLADVAFPPLTTLQVCAGAYVLGGALLFVMSTPARQQVRSLSVILAEGCSDLHHAMYAEWEAVVETLTTADATRERGELSPVEYEAVWWRAYDRLEVVAGV
jgi:hypothetical protein